MTRESTNEPEYSFVGQLDDVKSVISLLKAINFREVATCIVTDRGVRVTVETSKCVQMSAFLQAELFQDFHVQEEQVQFQVHLSMLIECLSIFGGISTTLKICYIGYGHPLTLLLEEEGVITDCNINTLEPDLPVEYNFSEAVNKVIIQSSALREVFSDLDGTTDLLTVTLSSSPPHFGLRTDGDAGETQTIIPEDSDAVEAFSCNGLISFRYKFTHIKVSFKAMTISEKTSVRMDDAGLLCFQYMISTDVVPCFIEYYCMPQITDSYQPVENQRNRRISITEEEEQQED